MTVMFIRLSCVCVCACACACVCVCVCVCACACACVCVCVCVCVLKGFSNVHSLIKTQNFVQSFNFLGI